MFLLDLFSVCAQPYQTLTRCGPISPIMFRPLAGSGAASVTRPDARPLAITPGPGCDSRAMGYGACWGMAVGIHHFAGICKTTCSWQSWEACWKWTEECILTLCCYSVIYVYYIYIHIYIINSLYI